MASDNPAFAELDANARITLAPGQFDTIDEGRNNGPAIWFNGLGNGVILTANSRMDMIRALSGLLERVINEPEPVANAKCMYCGQGIRLLPDFYDAEPEWRHASALFPRGDGGWTIGEDWETECRKGDGRFMTDELGSQLHGWPATDDEWIRDGDQVLYTYHLRGVENPYEPHEKAQFGISRGALLGGYGVDFEDGHGQQVIDAVSLRRVTPHKA